MELKMNGMIFLLAFILAFAGGYFFFTKGETSNVQSVTEKEDVNFDATNEDSEVEEQASAEFEIFSKNSCLSCHAVDSLNIAGGATGPDLSGAYGGVEDKHGIDLDSFLQNPTSAVMSGVIEGNPLSDEERKEIIEALQKAYEN